MSRQGDAQVTGGDQRKQRNCDIDVMRQFASGKRYNKEIKPYSAENEPVRPSDLFQDQFFEFKEECRQQKECPGKEKDQKVISIVKNTQLCKHEK